MAADGTLQVLEDVFPSGEVVIFSGNILARFSDDHGVEQQCFESWFDKACQWIAALGSQKGVGYGRLLSTKLERMTKPVNVAKLIQFSSNTTRIRLSLKLDRPFCIGRLRTPSSNRIESDRDIPGNVIKGVIARTLADQTGASGEQLSNILTEQLDFDNLIVTHAKPIKTGTTQRPQPIPLNLAKTANGWHEYTCEKPEEIEWSEAPIFQPDWKSDIWREAGHYLGISDDQPERYLVVRTAIESGISNVAKQKALFSLECMDPTHYLWCADIDLSNVESTQREIVLHNLAVLLHNGLEGIGKTKAQAEVTLQSQPFAVTQLGNEQPAYWQVTLVTAARILPLDTKILGTNDATTLQGLYQDYWKKESAGELMLENYFAQQQRKGGRYYNRRFRNGRNYRPGWLTRAGSVFILKPDNPDIAKEKLESWLRTGLPPWQSEQEPVNWKTTPHLAEHGYGEITVKAIYADTGETQS